MTDLTFDHLYPYAELTDAARMAAPIPISWTSRASGSHTRAATSGSPRSRTATGPHDEKPALFVEANIHATEITASTAALHLVHHLATGYGKDDAVTRALDTRCFYVVRGSTRTASRWPLPIRRNSCDPARASTRAATSSRVSSKQDIDGDGRVLTMRVPDPNGAWKVHPDDARLLVPRALDEDGPGDYYRLLPEGDDPRVRRRR